MISASVFSRQSGIWNAVAPTIDHVVRWANNEQISMGPPAPSYSDPARSSLISEVAFLLVKDRTDSRDREASQVEAQARDLLRNLPRSDALAAPLGESEWIEANAICDTLLSYSHWLKEPVFHPRVPGCGVVDEAVADIATQRELIEVKAVRRQFRGSDIRQVMTYLAMYQSKGVRYDSITLINPRAAKRFSVSVEVLCVGVGGRASVEVLQDVITWVSDLQVSG